VKRTPLEQGNLPGMEKPKQIPILEYEKVWTGDFILRTNGKPSELKRSFIGIKKRIP